jgi:hypothetical protein
MTDLGPAAPTTYAPSASGEVSAMNLLSLSYRAVRDAVNEVVDGLNAEQLAFRPSPSANSIAWLIWHLSRIQDEQASEVIGRRTIWQSQTFAERFALPFPNDATGYGQSAEEAAQVWVESSSLLVDYHHAVSAQTLDRLHHLTDKDLARVVDENQDPPVTAAVRLQSVVNDSLQHIGQAGYVRGLLEYVSD